ncbi:bifunctional ADP-dependent NAD(P)H-hydrate dehydratase/NAD(P)H-hydrate epimerase [Desulfotalea psychrophila]|uniref:Bifunctional NAD(P)H-hydrate repair enzyme n=1 Tax=Desulfotalea psychrophila (strain LSv54 / DSM 12343) TaxID=177439 RepID=Q6AK13_DESPS|nr:bifunctional ADP-dependent NAD(P)H-hydrate dehydratase/NAD(P)H-hydrate epimerase [Desulfotalea psychrophila]CAG37313.1 conserved hypothetical protein [Desulfotalea psychrophila LSv54]
MKLFTTEQMRKIDHQAINDYGIPGAVLMENAGRETVGLMQQALGTCANSFIPIFIGPGNNGGDGFVVGRHLYQLGGRPIFFLLSDPEKYTPDSKLNFHIAEKTGLPTYPLKSDSDFRQLTTICQQELGAGRRCYALVDALFGIGLDREIGDHYARIINLINAQQRDRALPQAPVISCDMPSGIHTETGAIMGVAIGADHTASYSFAKPGQMQGAGASLVGDLHILDIGAPRQIAAKIANTFATTGREDACKTLKTIRRGPLSHKGSHGHLLIVAGSLGMTGAAILASEASLAMGTGLTSLVTTKSLNPIFEMRLAEVITIPLSGEDNFFTVSHFERICQAAMGKKITIIGPGMGNNRTSFDLVKKLYQNLKLPMLIDADGLNALATERGLLTKAAGPRIFTPHPGEMARLLDISTEEVEADRAAAVEKFMHIFSEVKVDIVLLLKGAATLIRGKRGPLFINCTGNSGMATGGMGDVLAGMIAGLIAQGLDPMDATKLGAYLHGMAGDKLRETRGIGFTASELAKTIPLCRKELEETKNPSKTTRQ